MKTVDLRSGARVRTALRIATLSQHAAIGSAAQMRRLFADDYTLAEYRTHLGRLLGFFDPLERAAALSGAGAATRDYCRAQTLRDDLLGMGWSPREIDGVERCTRLPALDPAGIRGCTYVLLGSMLGGREIARRLRRILGGSAKTSFYGGGAKASDTRWTAFCADLERDDGDIDALCRTARATFDAYAAWICEPASARRR